jgi:hypothetical protein
MFDARNARRLRQMRHVYDAGPHVVSELLLVVDAGVPLDEALEEFTRIPVDVYHEVGADLLSLPIERLIVYRDGRLP